MEVQWGFIWTSWCQVPNSLGIFDCHACCWMLGPLQEPWYKIWNLGRYVFSSEKNYSRYTKRVGQHLIINWKSYLTFIKPNPPRLHINKPCNNICALEIMFIHYAIFMYIDVYLLTSLHIYTLAYNSNLKMQLHLYKRLYISHPIHSENLLFIWAYLWMSSRHWQ